ncbi:hypothetical protein OROGR_000191 [Orobanche gracilis]
MEQLPPKAPIPMSHNWPSFTFQMPPPPPLSSSGGVAPSSWADEFFDFSATRRGAHRRTVSDPIAFVEESVHHSSVGFEGLDDEQLRNMFSDDVAPAMGPSESYPSSAGNPSTPSDQNSDNEEKKNQPESRRVHMKNEPGEVDSSCQPALDIPAPAKFSGYVSGDNIVDPKRIKRILANRQSAQRSRVRKLQYISELERSVTTLQTEVSALSPRVAFLDHQRLLLNVDNSALKQRIAALAQDKIFKDEDIKNYVGMFVYFWKTLTTAHQEALKKEIERLRKIYHDQNIKNMGEQINLPHRASAAAAAADLQQDPGDEH